MSKSSDIGGRQEVLADLAKERAGIMSSIRGDNAGPMTFLREAPVDTFAASQETDPIRAALEAKYAASVAAAQTKVNEAALAPGGDIIYSSPQQASAKIDRMRLMQQAAAEFNRSLPPGDPRRKDEMANPAYGA